MQAAVKKRLGSSVPTQLQGGIAPHPYTDMDPLAYVARPSAASCCNCQSLSPTRLLLLVVMRCGPGLGSGGTLDAAACGCVWRSLYTTYSMLSEYVYVTALAAVLATMHSLCLPLCLPLCALFRFYCACRFRFACRCHCACATLHTIVFSLCVSFSLWSFSLCVSLRLPLWLLLLASHQ